MAETGEPIRPLARPFVVRPTLFVTLPCAFLGAANYFYWGVLHHYLGAMAFVFPVSCVVIPLLVLALRIVRYRKTTYELRPDRIVVRTGTLFGERTIELDLEQITMVEQRSPFLLDRFYGAGHITAQEAGSATQNARLAYVADPGRLYARIADSMRARGFSMQRETRVRRERPGPGGALLDLVGRLAAFLYAVVIFGFNSVQDIWVFLADDGGPSVRQLVEGNYDVFAETPFALDVLVDMRIGTIVLGALALLWGGLFIGAIYIDLLRRTYTLYDDVVDYEDGFLDKTYRFIPLENLADTKFEQPLHKRLFGFGDLRVSSRGASSAIVFQSLPRGGEFAAALEGLIEQTPDAPRIDLHPQAEVEGEVEPEGAAPRRRRTVRPWPLRAVVGAIVGVLPLAALFMAVPIFVVAQDEVFEIGPVSLASFGALLVGALVVTAGLAVVGAVQRGVKAWATEYSFDARRVVETFDFLTSRTTTFNIDKITSMSVLRNPLDLLMGTVTVKLRSIGTHETIDLAGIRHDREMIADLLEAVDLGAGAGASRPAPLDSWRPDYSIGREMLAQWPIFAAMLSVWGAGFALGSLVDQMLWFGLGAIVVTMVLVVPYLWWRAVYHRRVHMRFFENHLEVGGGLLIRFTHRAAWRHIRNIDALRYPLSTHGHLALATGGGYSLTVGHLPDLFARQDRLDEHLGGLRSTPADARTCAPHPATEVLRHLHFVVTLLTLPLSGPLVYLRYRRAEYLLERGRVVAEVGLVYRSRKTIRYDRIDHLETGRGLANTVFGTGDIEIYTVGSISRDLVLRSLHDIEGPLSTIRERIGQRRQ
jgi:membrane protein YdbS with pleckstrin-like domain